MTVNLNSLPDVTFAELDAKKVEASIITLYEGITNTVLYPGDPVRLFLSTLAAVIANRNVITDFTGKMNLLRYARGNYLDHIGAMLGVARLDPTPASVQQRFTLQEAQPANVVIPQGTRVTPDGKTYFASDTALVISAGGLTGDVWATCLTTGPGGNGFMSGQINRLVDPLPYMTSVENTVMSSGGADTEEDEPYRERIRLAPESFTTAGSELSYVFWALSANQNVSDVSVYSPVPGQVKVAVLLQGGVLPDPNGDEIADVREAVSGKKHRPLTDQVEVLPAVAVGFDYTVTWYITEEQAPFISDIGTAIKKAVTNYEAWQTAKIGRDLNPDKLIRACLGAGAKRVIIDNMEFTSLNKTQVVQFAVNQNRVVFGAIEDE